MKRIVIYVSVNRTSISVENGVERESAASTVTEAVKAMHPDDLGPLSALINEIHRALPQELRRLN